LNIVRALKGIELIRRTNESDKMGNKAEKYGRGLPTPGKCGLRRGRHGTPPRYLLEYPETPEVCCTSVKSPICDVTREKPNVVKYSWRW
jgi:hypothetical protein